MSPILAVLAGPAIVFLVAVGAALYERAQRRARLLRALERRVADLEKAQSEERRRAWRAYRDSCARPAQLSPWEQP